MSYSTPFTGSSSTAIETLIRALDSLTDGDLAVEGLIACGERAIAPLEEWLIRGKPQVIAIPRRRAVRALGGLGARKVLLEYFEKVGLPPDPIVLFAEDAVRSEVARELMRWNDEEIFKALLRGAKQRATLGLIEALGEFGRAETIPLLFECLEDDLCNGAAFAALLKNPEQTHEYAILCLRGEVGTTLEGPQATRRRRSVAQLLRRFKIVSSEWRDISRLLADNDPAVVICTASVGFCAAPEGEFPQIVQALFRVAGKLNWLQEDEMIHLLDEHRELAQSVAKQILTDLRAHGEDVNWLSPIWRILAHLNPAGFRRSER